MFPDVNILLHFPAFDGLDWKKVCQSDEVVIHIAQPVLGELNKVKDTGRTKAVRKRASATIKRLGALLKDTSKASELSTGVRVVFESESPRLENFPKLNERVNDDILIAAILTFNTSSECPAVLLTDDDGLALQVKAGDYGIRVFEPEECLRIAPETDDEDKEREKLRRENESLRSRIPEISLEFNSGGCKFFVQKKASDIESQGRREIAALKRRFQPFQLPPSDGIQNQGPVSAFARLALYDREPSLEQKTAYNDALSRYFQQCENVLRKNTEIDSRTIVLTLVIKNTGTVPAEDVLISMHFPNGFKLFENCGKHAIHERLPEPPEKPTGILQIRMPEIHLPYLSPYYDAVPRDSDRSLSIEETNSYDVKFEVKKIRQGFSDTITPLMLVFEEQPFSFFIDYTIICDGMPKAKSGKLHIVEEIG